MMLISDGELHSLDMTTVYINDIRDNEKPQRKTQVHAFQAQGRPITNEEVSLC